MAVPNYGNYRRFGGAAVPRRTEPGTNPAERRRRLLDRDRKRREARERVRAAKRRRSFVLFVLVPAALLLGSVYLHNVASDSRERIGTLEGRIESAEVRYERLGVREAELSSPERIRSLAASDGDMKDAGASQIEVLGETAESGDSVDAQGAR